MEARYRQAAQLQASVRGAFISGHVQAHWIADTPCFWYRKHVAKESFAFLMVNAETGESGPAFDHEALRSALSKQSIQVPADAWPFLEITIDSNLEIVRFYIDDKLWRYECESDVLLPCSTEEKDANHTADVGPMEKEVASSLDAPELKCCLTFINKRSRAIRVWWINYEGEPQMSKTTKPGKSCRRQTYSGHVWRVCDDETGDVIASYVTPHRETAFVTINEGTASPPEESASPGTCSSLRCFVKDFNVYVTGEGLSNRQLSSSGCEATPFDPEHIHYSRDGKYACVWQYTFEHKRAFYRIESTPQDQLQPRMLEKQYLKPGDKLRIDRPRLFDLTQGKEIPTSDVLFSNPYELGNIGWSSDDQKYRFIYNERGHKVLRIVELDIEGNARMLIEERQDTFVDYPKKVHWRYDKKIDELIWSSERDGTNHLYLVKLDGKLGLDNQLATLKLTHGACNVHHIDRVDKKERRIYVAMLGAVAGQDPYYMYLARLDMDGSNFTVLTTEDGDHKWAWSPDFKYFVDEWSRVDKAPETVLRDLNGKLILTFDGSDVSNLTSTGWRAPERFTAPGRDGKTPIYGIVIKPTDFSPDKSYPVIEEIYAGPHGFFVPKPFSRLASSYALAELGFVVVRIDGMGTNWRCRTFHEVCYKNLKDAGLPDRVAWLKAAARMRPWMNLARIAIFGCSAGGQNALSALLWHGDFYKVAIADCGCHDNRLDKLWWNELWMGWPVDEAYAANSNVVHAHRLTGALMLVVGEMDDNVDPASTLQVVHALNEAGKDYELLFVPGGSHGAGNSTKYLIRRQWDFFVRHLIGVETPRWNTTEVRERLSICYDEAT